MLFIKDVFVSARLHNLASRWLRVERLGPESVCVAMLLMDALGGSYVVRDHIGVVFARL